MPRSLPMSIAAFLGAVTVTVGIANWNDLRPQPAPVTHGSAPADENDILADDENLGAPFATYQSDTLHYTLRHPASWSVDDTHVYDAIDVLSDDRGLAIVTISKTDDPNLCDPWMMERLMQTLETAAEYDATLTQTSFAKVPWKRHWTLMGSSRRERADGSWLVRTFIVARPEYGGTLNITTQVRSDVETLFADDVQAILDSLSVNQGEY